MPKYNYVCNDCKTKVESDLKVEITSIEDYISHCLFETVHSISATDEELYEATRCPRCNSQNTEKTMIGSQITTFSRGYGFYDKKGRTRDMNMYKLKKDDPYGEYRTPGEVDHIADNLKKQGEFDPKPKHYVVKQDVPKSE